MLQKAVAAASAELIVTMKDGTTAEGLNNRILISVLFDLKRSETEKQEERKSLKQQVAHTNRQTKVTLRAKSKNDRERERERERERVLEFYVKRTNAQVGRLQEKQERHKRCEATALK